MYDLVLISSGIIIGLVVAAPIGPVNLICIRRTLVYGTVNGFFSDRTANAEPAAAIAKMLVFNSRREVTALFRGFPNADGLGASSYPDRKRGTESSERKLSLVAIDRLEG